LSSSTYEYENEGTEAVTKSTEEDCSAEPQSCSKFRINLDRILSQLDEQSDFNYFESGEDSVKYNFVES
jgi:hypothetical protein